MQEHDLRNEAADWLEALEEERLDQVGRALDVELERLGVRESPRARLRELIEGVWWSGGTGEGGRADVVSVVREVIPIVVGDSAEPLLALYIRMVCEEAWELTWDHAPLLEILDAAEASWDGIDGAGGATSVRESEAAMAVRAMAALRVELQLESACSTGDARRTADVAAHAVRTLNREKSRAAALQPSPLQEYVTDLLTGQLAYVQAVCVAAVAAADFLDGTGDNLDAAIEHLLQTEAAFDDHTSLSEIRAHRVALQRLAQARTEDWLRVDDGRVVCLFPFGIRHADQSEVVATVKEHAAQWVLAGAPLENNPTSLLLVDDIWRGDDPLSRRYEGTQLDLPDLHLHGADGVLLTARVTITISQLGNHYLRVEFPLRAAMPHTVAATVWMAAPEYGDLTELGQCFLLEGAEPPASGPGWPRLSQLAHRVLKDVVAALQEAGLAGVSLSFRPGMYHVLTTIREASVLPGGDADQARTLDLAARIPTLFGSQSITHPIPAGVGSVAFWARYASPLGALVDCAGLTDEYLLVSENHTLIASFSSPDFMVATVGQAAEFAASVEGMFAAWQDELSDFYLGLRPHLRRLETGEEVELGEVLSELERGQLRLRQFLTSARVTLLFIASPALVTSPVMRETITQLLNLRQVWVQRADFTDIAGQALADRVNDLIEAWLRRREAERDQRAEETSRRNQLRIDTMLAVLTGIGISGVLALLQTGFDMDRWGSIVLVVVVLALAAIVGLVSYRWSRVVASSSSKEPVP